MDPVPAVKLKSNLPFNSERMLQDDTIKSKKGASKDERTID